MAARAAITAVVAAATVITRGTVGLGSLSGRTEIAELGTQLCVEGIFEADCRNAAVDADRG